MKTLLVAVALLAIVIGGCGVNKEYVQEQIQASEGRTAAQISAVKGTADANKAEVDKLKALAEELSTKTDMALNRAKGFENYQIIWQGEVNFKFDSWEVTDVAQATLMEAGETMEKNPASIIEVAGHTDRTGSSKYNLLLGDKRAAAAKRFLADQFGISLYRMFTISYGEDKPVAMPDEKNAASKNRRVTLKIWGPMQ